MILNVLMSSDLFKITCVLSLCSCAIGIPSSLEAEDMLTWVLKFDVSSVRLEDKCCFATKTPQGVADAIWLCNLHQDLFGTRGLLSRVSGFQGFGSKFPFPSSPLVSLSPSSESHVYAFCAPLLSQSHMLLWKMKVPHWMHSMKCLESQWFVI